MFMRSSLLIACLLAACCRDALAVNCAADEESISVVNTTASFCVGKPSCSGESSNGKCPGPQQRLLEFGSYCGLVKPKTHGCIPLSMPPALVYKAGGQTEDANAADCSMVPNLVQMTVEGIGNLCARTPICSGNFSTGNCPTTLTSLTDTYSCVQKNGVGDFGCVA